MLSENVPPLDRSPLSMCLKTLISAVRTWGDLEAAPYESSAIMVSGFLTCFQTHAEALIAFNFNFC